MSVAQATCPLCGASFQVEHGQLAQAGGRVRCGNCLRVFDGIHGEVEFIAPQIPEAEISHPVSGLDIKPMLTAELPQRQRTSWSSVVVLLGLLATLAAQLHFQGVLAPARPQGVELASVAVRPHPQVEGALRIDAVLGNPADTAAAYPRLILSFTSRQGEMRARRTFTPAEYLHGNQPLRIPPRSEMQVSLAIADPGRDAVNYLLQLDSSLSIID